MTEAPSVRGRSLSVKFEAAQPLNGVTFDFTAHDYPVALVGPSGSGKSTLLNVISGALAPHSGEVMIGAQPVQRATWRTSSDHRVSTVFQDHRLVGFLTVEENILLAREVRDGKESIDDGKESIDSVDDALGRVNLSPDFKRRLPGTLSGGEQQRVAIARALFAGCSVLLADEPTGALDPANTRAIADLLRQVSVTDSVAVIVATHDPEVADRASRRYRLGGGTLTPEGV